MKSLDSVNKPDALNQCNNTADADKPVSTAQQTALDLKANAADAAMNSENLSELDNKQAAANTLLDVAGASDEQVLTKDTASGDVMFKDAAGGGVTDHGNLDGRGDDDHSQYHTDARGDSRYAKRGNNLTDLTNINSAISALIIGASELTSAPVAADELLMRDTSAAAGRTIGYDNFIGKGKVVFISYVGSGSIGKQVPLTGINRAYEIRIRRANATHWGPEDRMHGATGAFLMRIINSSAARACSLNAALAGTSQILTINTNETGINQSGGIYHMVITGTPI